jgi:hypothetical protein
VAAWETQREDVRKLKVLRGEKARSAEVAEAECVAIVRVVLARHPLATDR